MHLQELEQRINKLPIFHLYYVISLLSSGAISLTFCIGALSEELYDCPVLNTTFIVFWFYAAVCIIQLCLGFGVLIAIFVLAWDLYFRGRYLGQLTGPNGYVFTQPTVWFADWAGYIQQLRAEQSRRTSNYLFTYRQLRCCPNTVVMKWAQPILILSIVLLVAHVIAFTWSFALQQDIVSPDAAYSSRVMSLFVEAKIQHYSHESTVKTPAKTCWYHIQSIFDCCGATGFNDWLPSNTTTTALDESLQAIPETCFCKAAPHLCYNHNALPTANGPIYSEGCLEPLILEVSRHVFTLSITTAICFVMVLTSALADLIYTLWTAGYVIRYMEFNGLNIPTGRGGRSGSDTQASC